LGRGAFGKVMLVEKKDTKEIFALKSLRKEEIIDKVCEFVS
jgi:serum/glucocorticoid-regulated kinase 2